LAQRHHSLEMTEVRDVITVIQDFEAVNRIHIVFAFSLLPRTYPPILTVTVTAFEPPAVDVEPAALASVQFNTSTTNLRFLRDVVTHGLYMLDGKLAYKELQEGTKK